MSVSNLFDANVHHHLGPIRALYEDETITNIHINRYNDVWIRRRLDDEHLPDVGWPDEHALWIAIEQIGNRVEQHPSRDRPLMNAQGQLGERLARFNAVLPPLAVRGPTLTIRFHRQMEERFTLENLRDNQTLTARQYAFLHDAVKTRRNMIVVGAPNAGKTTLLYALLTCHPKSLRLVIVDETHELEFEDDRNWTAMEVANTARGKVTLADALSNSLRLAGNLVIVGEARTYEAGRVFLGALNIGYQGSAGTIHATSCTEAYDKLRAWAVRDDAPELINLLDIMVFLRQTKAGHRVTEITVPGPWQDGRRARRVIDLDSTPAPDLTPNARHTATPPMQSASETG